ncbi:MAG: efflux RND transporter periplasmic adaptor subunit [Myxococcales bacterium]|nr:efflux RND transporter periplasmic adaptor subunit [Myxococcales bacterium]
MALAACQGPAGGPPGKGGPGKGPPDAAAEAPPAPVEVTRLATGPISDGLEGTATVQARVRAEIRSRAGGTVLDLAVEEGATVKAGDLLARIDQPTYQSVLGKARAAVEKANRDVQSARRLAKQGVLPGQQLQDAEFELRQARLEVQRLEDERGLGRVTAPIAGVVVARHVEQGEAISAGAVLFEVADLTALEIDLYVPERHLARLRTGLPVEVTAEGAGDARLRGEVERIAPTVDPRSGTVKVTVALGDGEIDPQRRLRPGMYTRARIVLDTREAAVLMPRRAVVYEDDRPFAFRVVDGKAEKRALELGYTDRDQVEVRAPLTAGDIVIVFGQRGLQDGAAVKIVDAPADPPGAAAPTPTDDQPTARTPETQR